MQIRRTTAVTKLRTNCWIASSQSTSSRNSYSSCIEVVKFNAGSFFFHDPETASSSASIRSRQTVCLSEFFLQAAMLQPGPFQCKGRSVSVERKQEDCFQWKAKRPVCQKRRTTLRVNVEKVHAVLLLLQNCREER